MDDGAPLGMSAPAGCRRLPDPRMQRLSNVDALAAVVGSLEGGNDIHLHPQCSRQVPLLLLVTVQLKCCISKDWLIWCKV